jgi:hypothetical protein
MHLNINVATWLKTRTKFRHGASNSFRNATYASMVFGKQSDDAIGFA